MTERKRTNRGKPVEREATFYCRYGNHYCLPIAFEKQEGNKGICLECAFEVQKLLGAVSYFSAITAKDEIQARKTWHADREREAKVKAIRGGSNDPGWVYYVAQDNLIKIGYATDVTQRIKAYGPTAVLLAAHPGTKNVERAMHVRFRPHLDSGREWFTRGDDLMEHIDSVIAQYGDPQPLAYQWTKPRPEEDKVRAMTAPRPDFASLAVGAHSAR